MKKNLQSRNINVSSTVHTFLCAEFYEKVAAYKAKGLKVLVAIGGWNDSAGDKYSRLVNNPGARARFISYVTDFIEKHNFDGLDLDWEYPKCWQVKNNIFSHAYY
jgi:chitinase